jgi:hypothetical protein
MDKDIDILDRIRARSVDDLPKRQADPALAYFWLGFFLSAALLAKLLG